MFCGNCGKEIKTGAKFCPSCGSSINESNREQGTSRSDSPEHYAQDFSNDMRIPDNNANEKLEPTNRKSPSAVKAKEAIEDTVKKTPKSEPNKTGRKKKSKLKVVLIIVIVLAALCGGGYLAISYLLPQSTVDAILGGDNLGKMIQALEDQDYDTALEIYQVNYRGSSSTQQLAAEALLERLEAIKVGYIEDTLEYAILLKELDTIESMKIKEIEDAITEVRTYASELNSSRTAFETARTLYESGDYKDSIAQYRLVIEEDKNYEAAKDGLIESVNAYRSQMMEQASVYALERDYESAISTLKLALSIIDNDLELTKQLTLYETEAVNNYRAQMLEKAELYALENDYNNAISTLQSALDVVENDVELAKQLTIYKEKAIENSRTEALNKADGYFSAGDYSNAINTLRQALKNELENDTELTRQLNDYEIEYSKSVILQADALVSENNYDGAVSLLETALKVIPGNADLLAKQSVIEAAVPVKLTEMKITNSDRFEQITDAGREDSLGNLYSPGNLYNINTYRNNIGYCEFYTGGKYTRLSGTVAVSDNSSDISARLEIYADDELIYNSGTIGRSTVPFTVDVDISDSSWIKIQLVMVDGWNQNLNVLLSNFILKMN